MIQLTFFVGNPSIVGSILEFTASSFIDKNYNIQFIKLRFRFNSVMYEETIASWIEMNNSGTG